ncbi:MAG: hypothetical protein WCP21_06265, partial [Armatimonadota bacterium]
MTENTRLRLGAYFLFAILLLTLPVTLLVTHLDTARHAQQWVATDTGVKLVNADHHDRSVAWVQKSYGLSKSGAQKFAYDTERKTKTRLDTTQTVPYGTQIDYYDVDGRKAPQTAKILNSMIVEKASSPAALDYIAAVQNPEWKKSEPTAAADALDALQSTLKKGYVLIPAAFTQSAAQAQKTGSGTSTGRASTASNPRHGLNIPAGRSTKATTTHYRVAVVATRFPGWRDIAPRSDYDTDPNDSGMASQGATGYSPITVTYGTGASNPGAATPAYTPVEVCYRQAIQNPLLPPPPNVYNYATRINAGADATFRDEPYSLAGYVAGHNLDLGSLYDSPGGVFSTTNWGIPGGVVGGWDYTEAPTWPAPMDSTITDLQNRFYDWLYDPGMSALSANNWFYQNTHGQVRIDGAPSDVYGWNFSAHVTNRYVYQTGGGNEELIFPGTPIIRSGVSGSNPAADQIVRASLSGNGLTILFSRPVPNFNVGNLSLVVYTNSTVTTGVTAPNYTQTTGGYVKIVWGATPVTYSVQQDPYDNRRWTVRAGGGSGFKYQALSGATATPTTTSLPWVPQEGTLWNLAYNGWPDTNGTVLTATTVGSLGNADPNVSPISFTYQNQTNSPDTVHYAASQGSPLLGVGEGAGDPFADSTLICDADMKLALFDSGQAIAGIGTPNAAVGFDARSYARLRSIDYYAHNYMGAGNAYQISHTYTVGPSSGSLFPDDIAGTTYTGSQHVLRPPPFDHDSSDPGNGGYWSRVNEKYSGNHRYGKYIADVGRVMQDNGITVPSAATGYQAVIYVAADNLGNPGTSVGETNPAGTTFQPASDLQGLNESSGLGTYFHELSHALVGAADLYDRNLYDNAGSPPPVPPYHQCNMMGPYSIMAAGGRLDAYHLAGGLVTPVDVQQDTLGADIPEIEG